MLCWFADPGRLQWAKKQYQNNAQWQWRPGWSREWKRGEWRHRGWLRRVSEDPQFDHGRNERRRQAAATVDLLMEMEIYLRIFHPEFELISTFYFGLALGRCTLKWRRRPDRPIWLWIIVWWREQIGTVNTSGEDGARRRWRDEGDFSVIIFEFPLFHTHRSGPSTPRSNTKMSLKYVFNFE